MHPIDSILVAYFHVTIDTGYVQKNMKIRIDILVDESERKLLDRYCQATGRTNTDALRELIRTHIPHTLSVAFKYKNMLHT
jgi:hypothetical protein